MSNDSGREFGQLPSPQIGRTSATRGCEIKKRGAQIAADLRRERANL